MILKDVLELFNFRRSVTNHNNQLGWDEETKLIRIYKDECKWIDFGCYDYSSSKHLEEFLSHDLLYTKVMSLGYTEGTEDDYPILEIALEEEE